MSFFSLRFSFFLYIEQVNNVADWPEDLKSIYLNGSGGGERGGGSNIHRWKMFFFFSASWLLASGNIFLLANLLNFIFPWLFHWFFPWFSMQRLQFEDVRITVSLINSFFLFSSTLRVNPYIFPISSFSWSYIFLFTLSFVSQTNYSRFRCLYSNWYFIQSCM